MGDFPHLFSIDTLILGKLFPRMWFIQKKYSRSRVNILSRKHNDIVSIGKHDWILSTIESKKN